MEYGESLHHRPASRRTQHKDTRWATLKDSTQVLVVVFVVVVGRIFVFVVVSGFVVVVASVLIGGSVLVRRTRTTGVVSPCLPLLC